MDGELVKPAPRTSTYHNYDAQVQADQINQWQQEYDQLSSGPFFGRFSELQLDSLHLFKENTSVHLRQQCRVNKRALWFGFATTPQSFHLNERQSDAYQLIMRTGMQDFELITPEDFSIYSVVIDTDKNSADSLLMESYVEQYSENSLVGSPSADMTQRLDNLKRYIDHVTEVELHYQSDDVVRKLVVDGLLQCLEDTKAESSFVRERSRQTQVIKQLKGLIKESGSEPLTITELCQSLHTSRRALQYACETKLGCSPYQFLLVTRLNRVKRVLSDPSNEQAIADIALSFGFFHYGIFSKHYKKLFGELPSQTVQRAVFS